MDRLEIRYPMQKTLKDISNYTIAIAVICVTLFSGFFVLFEDSALQREKQNARLATLYQLVALGSEMESQLKNDISLVGGLVATVALNPDISAERINQYSQEMMRGRNNMRNIAVAQGYVIKTVYPIEGNESVLGLDYRTLPAQFEAVERVRQGGKIVVAGPLSLVQGGVGIIARIPIFTAPSISESGRQEFWGFVSTVIDFDKFLDFVGLNAENQALNLAIRGKDGLGENGDIFYGDPSLFEQEALLYDVAIPNGTWQIAAVPSGGWPTTYANAFTVRSIFVLVLLLTATLSYLLVRQHIEKSNSIIRVQASETKFRKIFELAHDAIFLVDRHTREIFDANPYVYDYLGYRPSELIGRKTDILYFDGEITAKSNMKSVIGGKKTIFETTQKHKDGSAVAVEINALPLNIDGRDAVLAIVRDISERKAVETKLIAAEAKADIASKAKSRFLANFSHELRTPLNAIIGFSSVIMSGTFGKIGVAKYEDYISDIHNSGNHLLALINDILDISRIEAGELTLKIQDQSAKTLIEEAVNLMTASLDKKSIQIKTHFQNDYLVKVDPLRCRQILLNILGNAIKFSPEGSQVSISLEAVDRTKCAIVIEDHGPGMTTEELSQAYKLYGRFDPTHRGPNDGAGLGIPIAADLAEKMGGELTIESIKDEGTRVTITFMRV